MSLENISFNIDPNLLNYNGSTSLSIFARKTENEEGDLTTYTIQPIKSQIKLFAWLQEHFEFFNKIVTYFLTQNIQKDPDCHIFQNLKIHPKSQGQDFQEDLIQEMANNQFFGYPDEDDLRKPVAAVVDDAVTDADWDNFSFGHKNNNYFIRISLAAVRKVPEKVLNAFYEKCFLQDEHKQTLEIKALEEGQEESQGVDAGGLRRQFITNLFNGLAKKTSEGTGQYLASSSHSTGGWMPVPSKKCRPEEEESLYVAIGKFMGMCYASQGSLVMGQIFNPSIFDVISEIPPYFLSMNYQDLPEDTKIALYCALKKRDETDKLIKFCNEKNPRSCTQDYLQEMVMYAYINDPELIPEELEGSPTKDIIINHFSEIMKQLKEQVKDYAINNDSLPLIFKMAQGIAWHFWEQNEWADQTESVTAWDLDSKIQGLFNKELVKDALTQTPGETDPYDYRRIKAFFDKWIKEADEDLVKKLVQAATGSTTLGAEEKIYLTITADTDALVSYHTCARQVDVGSFTDYDTFKEKLEKSLEYCDLDGFQFV